VPKPAGRAALAFIFVSIVLDIVAFGIIIPVLPKLVESFVGNDVSRAAEWVGVFGTVWALMQFICAPVLGALSDRFGRRPVLLADQDRGRWDRLLIRRGLDALARAQTLSPQRGAYTLQAAIASRHALAATTEATDWPGIAALYAELEKRTGLRPTSGWERIHPGIPNLECQHLLGIDATQAVFLVERYTEHDAGPLEWRETTIRGDAYTFLTDWTNTQTTSQFTTSKRPRAT